MLSMKVVFDSSLASCMKIASTAIFSAAIGFSSVLPVAAATATFTIQGIFNDSQPFSGILLTENNILVDYQIEVGSSIVPTQYGFLTIDPFTYSPTTCHPVASYCFNSGSISSTLLEVNSSAVSGSNWEYRTFSFNFLNGFSTNDNIVISGNAFESFSCSRCGGNAPSGFERGGDGVVTLVSSEVTVPEPTINWAVLSASILCSTVLRKKIIKNISI
ncbi:hypothetical protein NOS3756_25200 [Nostoc sp. NIES-3756]|nr:hypothetical protein NOS3756_25200 [Nostoc sp. NIES-3756]